MDLAQSSSVLQAKCLGERPGTSRLRARVQREHLEPGSLEPL